MKTNLIIIFIIFLLNNRLSAQTTFPVNTVNSIITWTGHAEVGSYAPAGTLKLKDGTVTVKEKQSIAAKITVDMGSMKQDNEHLLEHLKSSDFFDVLKYPVSTIKIDRVINGNAYGKLTIKNKTLPFQSPVTIDIKDGITTISGKTIVDRTKYGIIYNSGNFFSGLGDKAIKNTFDVAFNISLKM